MKKQLFCLTLIIAGIINQIYSQNYTFDTTIVLDRLEKMKKELKLTDEQMVKLKPLLFDDYEKNEMFKKNIEVIQSVQMQNNQTTEYEMSKILTAEQNKRYLEKKEKAKADKKDLRIREKMAFYRQELKLSDQQYKDLKLLIEKTSVIKEQVKNNFKNNDARLKEEMKKVRKEFDDQLGKILSKQQFEKFKEIQKTGKSN